MTIKATINILRIHTHLTTYGSFSDLCSMLNRNLVTFQLASKLFENTSGRPKRVHVS